ncbi:hypothetical protein BGZ65_004688 [Modicella reniformis]|uniref:Uncharacterized protein n=1 Tax=Modicella reniformis TaxID=1440133 RepID=A0A9P6M8U3_9FUNG|nr:hypothetical protein BGZ65_004688 [Modicella reniformis]
MFDITAPGRLSREPPLSMRAWIEGTIVVKSSNIEGIPQVIKISTSDEMIIDIQVYLYDMADISQLKGPLTIKINSSGIPPTTLSDGCKLQDCELVKLEKMHDKILSGLL